MASITCPSSCRVCRSIALTGGWLMVTMATRSSTTTFTFCPDVSAITSPSFGVLEESPLDLFPQPSGGDHAFQQRRGPEPLAMPLRQVVQLRQHGVEPDLIRIVQ